jgi:hypothetical protein
MKNYRVLLLTLVASLLMFSSCGGDETEKEGVSFDGNKLELPWVGIDMGDYADGNYEIAFLVNEPAESVWDEIPRVVFQIAADWDGTEVDLTEVDDLYGWSWYVELETEASYLWGFGPSVEDFNDITGGYFKITELDAETRTFEIDGKVEFGEMVLKVYYKGELEEYNVQSVGARTEKRGN